MFGKTKNILEEGTAEAVKEGKAEAGTSVSRVRNVDGLALSKTLPTVPVFLVGIQSRSDHSI